MLSSNCDDLKPQKQCSTCFRTIPDQSFVEKLGETKQLKPTHIVSKKKIICHNCLLDIVQLEKKEVKDSLVQISMSNSLTHTTWDPKCSYFINYKEIISRYFNKELLSACQTIDGFGEIRICVNTIQQGMSIKEYKKIKTMYGW